MSKESETQTLFRLESPSGTADMAVDLRSCRIDFHTVPAHMRAAPEFTFTIQSLW